MKLFSFSVRGDLVEPQKNTFARGSNGSLILYHGSTIRKGRVHQFLSGEKDFSRNLRESSFNNQALGKFVGLPPCCPKIRQNGFGFRADAD
jgi:hypothetical protein